MRKGVRKLGFCPQNCTQIVDNFKMDLHPLEDPLLLF